MVNTILRTGPQSTMADSCCSRLCPSPATACLHRLQDSRVARHVRKHHTSLVIAFLVFAVLCGASVSIYTVFSNASEKRDRDGALQLADETGSWFADQLERALLVPIFSLAQFATELEIFRTLPDQIGPAGANGSLPYLPPTGPGQPYTHRNVTGVCDDPSLMSRFNEIAAAIKHNAKMEGVLVNLQLAPEAVVCLLYPLNNTEDFPSGVFMDNTGARGLDLLSDPDSKYIAGSTLKQDEVVIAGPLSLRQCKNCDATVEKAFIARLPIEVPYHQIAVDGVPYNRWGFATALINWETLINQSGAYETFAERNMEFQLTRTDRKYNESTQLYYENVVVLAETIGFQSSQDKRVTTNLQTTNNEWEMTVAYASDSTALRFGMIVLCVALSTLITLLVYTVLIQKEIQTDQMAKVEIERNITAYFAHELRNPLGAIDCALSALPEDQLPDSTKELLSGMRLCTSFMSSVMNNLLDLRKMEEGKMLLFSQPMSLKRTVNDVHKMLLASVKEGVAFCVVCRTDGRDWVSGDFERLQQALTNIVTNAIKYTSVGSITLSVEWQGSTRVRFTCTDTGTGIPKDIQARLFEKYVQRGGAPGTGLGLAIAKHIVTLMGGDIRFDSDPSVRPGTTCIITVPMEHSDKVEESCRFDCDDLHPIQDALSFLLVDDIKMNRTMLRRRIERGIAPHCTITEAATGEEALKLCATASFDVIVVDHFMEKAGGVMLGTDVVVEMRSMKMGAIIIGSSGNDLESEFRAAGADFVWRKPIPSNDTIIQQLRSVLLNR